MLLNKITSAGANPGALSLHFYNTHLVFRVSDLAALGPYNKLNTYRIYQIRIDLNSHDMCTYDGYIIYNKSIG